MASTYSPLKIELIGTGEQAGTWGSTTNTNLGTAIEQAIGGKADITMSSTSETLTLTNTNAAQDARALYLNLTGTPGGAATLNVPAVQKAYIVRNGTNQTVTVKVTGQTGVAVPSGKTMHLYNNGTDVVNAFDNLAAGTTIGGSPIGTGSGSVTSVSGTGTVQGLTLSGTVTSSGNLTLGGSLSAVNLASQVTGTLPIANGGTGSTSTTYCSLTTNVTGTLPAANGGTAQSTYTTGDLIYASGTNTLAKRAIGSTGQVLTVSGGAPVWSTPAAGGVTSVTASSPLASSGGSTPNISFTGTLGAANGGTGQNTYIIGDLLYASGVSTLTKRAIGTNGQVLTVSAGVPTWATPTGGVTGAGSSVDSGVVLFSGTGGATLKSSASSDGFIYGLRIGRGTNARSTNTVLGASALNSNTTGDRVTAVGYTALVLNTSGSDNTAVGAFAADNNTTGNQNTAVGSFALDANTTGSRNTGIGYGGCGGMTTASDSIGIGWSTIGGNAGTCVAVGNYALFSSSLSGGSHVAIGYNALRNNTSGNSNTAVGYDAGLNITTGTQNACLGQNSGTASSPFNITTESFRVVVGNSGTTNAYIQVAWTVVSDGRDKEDVEDAPYGLDFVSRLRPVQYKWDKRSSYYETTEDGTVIKHEKDGSKKEDKLQLGFIAQEVIALEKEFGAVEPVIGDEEQEDSLKVTETKFIPVLVKAIQELKAELDSVKAELAALKG